MRQGPLFYLQNLIKKKASILINPCLVVATDCSSESMSSNIVRPPSRSPSLSATQNHDDSLLRSRLKFPSFPTFFKGTVLPHFNKMVDCQILSHSKTSSASYTQIANLGLKQGHQKWTCIFNSCADLHFLFHIKF